MAKRVLTGCRDCKKCSISGIGKTGRNAGRGMAFLMTAGMSEVAMAATKDCGACGHALSLHEDQKVTGWKQQADAAAAAPPAPPKPKVKNASGSISISSTADQVWDAVVGAIEPEQLKKQDPAKRKATFSIKNPGTPATNGTVRVQSSTEGAVRLNYDFTPSFGSLISAGEDPEKVNRLNAVLRDEATSLIQRVEERLGIPFDRPAVGETAAPAALETTQEPPQGGGSDLVEQLQKLADLHHQGVLSADEFAAAKARLIG